MNTATPKGRRNKKKSFGHSWFKSIRVRILFIFVLLIFAIMLFIGTTLPNSISKYYLETFSRDMSTRVFTPLFVEQLEDLCGDDPDSFNRIKEVLDAYSGRRMGINAFRSYYILDGSDARVLFSSEQDSPEPEGQVEITANILRALTGETGNSVHPHLPVMDYAVGLRQDGEIKYVVYVRDTKRDLGEVIGNIYVIILTTLTVGTVIFVAFGLFLAQTITAPISHLRAAAERLADGDFDYMRIERLPKDEIGDLGRAFNKMARALRETLLKNYSERTKLETILRYQADGIIAFNALGAIIHTNPVAHKMLNPQSHYTFGDIFKKNEVDVDLMSLLYLEQFTTVERIIRAGKADIKAIFAPFRNEDGEVGGVVVVLSDITEQQRLEMVRREFVANVSHELRTPLTTIKSYTETLIDSAPTDNMTSGFLNTILNEADRMTRIVKDLLTLSKLDYEKGTSNNDAFFIDALLNEVVQKLSVAANNTRGVTLHYRQSGEPVAFWGERDRIEQVFTNIISNAYKYTTMGGHVDVSCSFLLTEVKIIIKDTGIGIPAEDLPRIFERFYRVDKARSREFGGTGLGLAIAKEIVDAHNGNISISSTPGVGTAVTIRFPLFGTTKKVTEI